jgi:hypothetical protein
MTRMKKVTFRLALMPAAAMVLLFSVCPLHAQQPAPAAPPAAKTPDAKAAAKPTPTDELDEFAPKPAPPLPAGMTGSDTRDKRYTLKAGMYNAGEASMGMKHLFFLKKPTAFRLDATSPDDPQVDKTLKLLGMGDSSKMPAALKPVIAQLAYANSDFAFQGDHLFQGNFYGVSIYDIADPAKTKLLTTLCVRVDRGTCRCTDICCSCPWRCRMDGWIAARRDFLRILHRQRGMRKSVIHRRRRRTASAE